MFAAKVQSLESRDLHDPMNSSTSDGQASAPKTDVAWSLVYYIALALIVLLAAYERFHLPPPPLADPDSWGYLGPAVLKLGGEGFQHTYSRNFLYPGFLLLILGLTNNFGAITIIQHLLGLGTGGLMIGCWAKTRRFVRHISPRMHDALGLAVGAIYLLSRQPIEYEHLLRPQAITPFFAILNILLTLHFFDMRRREGPSWSGAIIAALVLVSSILLVTLRASFALTILFSGLPVLIALFDRRETWPRRAVVILVPLITAAVVLRTEQILAKSDPQAKWWLPTTLFTIHANLIAQQMDEDIARGDCGRHGCEWLHEVSASLHKEIEKSRHLPKFWRSLRFDPDYLMLRGLTSTLARSFLRRRHGQAAPFRNVLLPTDDANAPGPNSGKSDAANGAVLPWVQTEFSCDSTGAACSPSCSRSGRPSAQPAAIISALHSLCRRIEEPLVHQSHS